MKKKLFVQILLQRSVKLRNSVLYYGMELIKLDAKIGYSETQEALELDHGGENFRTFFIEGVFYFFILGKIFIK